MIFPFIYLDSVSVSCLLERFGWLSASYMFADYINCMRNQLHLVLA